LTCETSDRLHHQYRYGFERLEDAPEVNFHWPICSASDLREKPYRHANQFAKTGAKMSNSMTPM
jgi:hypothetical protein